ncbi:NAD(P)/FAD-dependent oxidoreductase [Oleomonas cavernae]|uniref:NAD(P)/FAD-dependent oxidoreductase n=1 Tax=Oleomonas cavernae TaxID=2320859 RepID=UPI003083A3BB
MPQTALIIGAGVIGLAIARELARRGCEVIVAERTAGIGNGVSSRNSEVIHGGMYYPTGSARHRHCVAGRRALYDFCASHGVAHARVGKLIVATDGAEAARIEAIHATGLANGVEDLALIDGPAARALEPQLACSAAVLSPQTGIVDSHGLMLALQGELEDHGGAIAFNTPISRVEQANGWTVHFGGADPG